MKIFNFLMMAAISATLLVGCTAENLSDNPLNEQTDLIMDQDNFTAQEGDHSFIFTGSGDLRIINPVAVTYCDNLTQVDCEGKTFSTTYGQFNTIARMCTNWKGTNEIEGKHVFPKGELYFYSNESGVDARGRTWHNYIYTGGTGMFMNASGRVKVYEESAFHTAYTGTYTNTGSGTLYFNMK